MLLFIDITYTGSLPSYSYIVLKPELPTAVALHITNTVQKQTKHNIFSLAILLSTKFLTTLI